MNIDNKISSVLVLIVMLACNAPKNMVGTNDDKISVRVPNNSKLLSEKEASFMYKEIGMHGSWPYRFTNTYQINRVLVNVQLTKDIDHSTSLKKKGIIKPRTLRSVIDEYDWVYIKDPNYKGFQFGKSNNIEYATMTLDWDARIEREDNNYIRRTYKKTFAMEDFTKCVITFTYHPNDSINGVKVYNYIIKHLKINKQTVYQDSIFRKQGI